jgi:hypothetical protein
MAYQVGSACYPSAIAAAQAVASSQIGSIVNHESGAYVVGINSVTGTAINYSLNPVAGGSSFSVNASFAPQPCNLLTWEDGLSVGWMIGAVWIATYAVIFMARAFRGETGGDYGNA